MADEPSSLGPKLRKVRAHRGLSLREISGTSGLASGYLSQPERGEVNQPTPLTLKRLADAYGVPMGTLMGWAGHDVPDAPASPHLARALSALGPDPSEGEVKAIEAVLEILRGRAGFSQPHFIDHPLSAQDQQIIREHALELLREADVYGEFPTRLDVLMDVAKLVYAGEISLTAEEHRGLLRRLGGRLKWGLDRSNGWSPSAAKRFGWRRISTRCANASCTRTRSAITSSPRIRSLPTWRTGRRWIRACATCASVKPTRPPSSCSPKATGCETWPTIHGLIAGSATALARVADLSLQATGRRLAEDSKRLCATVIYYKGGGRLMPPHIYTSVSFEARFLWKRRGAPHAALRESIRTAAVTQTSQDLVCGDGKDRRVVLRCEGIDTGKALIGLKDPGGPIAKMFPVRGTIKVRGAA